MVFTDVSQMAKKKHPNPFYLGTLKRSLSERDAEASYSTMK